MIDHPSALRLHNETLIGQRSGVQTMLAVLEGETVFVKTLLTGDAETAALFHHEGDVVLRLYHPGIVPLLQCTESQLVFQYIPGGTLRDLARCGPMTAEEASEVTWAVLRIAEYIHAQGVVHQDIKPENVLLLGGNPTLESVRLTDFGMSHAQHLQLDIHSGTRMGTPHFMAPEQFQGVRGDPRSDLYSIGVLLFDCLAGHPPYEDALGWLVGISENRAEFPGPAALHSVMKASIQRERSDRPESATEMLELLRVARRQLGFPELP